LLHPGFQLLDAAGPTTTFEIADSRRPPAPARARHSLRPFSSLAAGRAALSPWSI